MNAQKIILGAGALILTVGAFFAGKANTAFTTTSIWTKNSAGTCRQVTVASSTFTTNGVAGTKVTFYTVAGGQQSLYSNSTCTSAIPNQVFLR